MSSSGNIVTRDTGFGELLFNTYKEAGCDRFLLIQPDSKHPLRDENTGSWRIANVSTAFQHWLDGGNVALVPAWIGAVVLDFDPPPGHRIEISQIIELLTGLGIEKTPVTLSPGQRHEGGAHVYFKDPGDGWNIKPPRIAECEIHVRRKNYILLPPSSIDDKEYQWLVVGDEMWVLGAVPLAKVPDNWLVPARESGPATTPTAGASLEVAVTKLAQHCRSGDREFTRQALVGDWPTEKVGGVDRSGAEYRLARICQKAGLSPAETAVVVQASAVHQAKFGNRRDERERLAAVVEAAFKGRERKDNDHDADIIVIPLSKIPREQIRFLIYPYLPRGELTILDGDPGIGKSWIWMALVAGLTGSPTCPVPYDHTAPKDAVVAVLTTEDSFGKTVRGRIEDLGGDLDRIFIFATESADTITAAEIERALPHIEDLKPDFIIVDPITVYVTGTPRLDMAQANHVRRALQPLVSLARSLDCSVLACRHFRKATGGALYRGLGSIDFVATARSVLTAGFDKATGKRVLAHTKSNVAPLGPSLAFEIVGDTFRWVGMVEDIKADDLTDEDRSQERGARREAAEFLREILQPGPQAVRDILRLARELGISEKTLRRAAKDLHVRAVQRVDARGRNYWEWCLN